MPLKLTGQRFVSFKAPIFGKDDPQGFEDSGIPEAAQFLVSGLRNQQVEVTDPANRGDWANDFRAHIDGRTIECILASTDEDHPLVLSLAISGRLFERGAEAQTQLSGAMAQLCSTIHKALLTEPRITNIRWHSSEQWDAQGQPFSPIPDGMPPLFQ